MFKGTRGGLVVQFSACKDSETAADTEKLSGGIHTGAATYLFIEAVERLIKKQQPLTCAPPAPSSPHACPVQNLAAWAIPYAQH